MLLAKFLALYTIKANNINSTENVWHFINIAGK